MNARFALGLMALLLAGNGLGRAVDAEDWPTIAEVSARQLRENPKNEEAWTALARAQIAQGDLQRAEKTLEDWKAKVASPGEARDRAEGELALKKADAPRAVEAFQRSVKKAPKDPDAWRLLSTAYAAAKDWANSIEAMDHVIAIRPDAVGFVQRTRLRIWAHDWAGAQADIRRANELDAADPGVQMLFPKFERSATWLPMIKSFDERVKKEPRDYQALLNRAEWLRFAGFTHAAREDIDAALKINPQSLRARFWAGLAAQEQHAAEERQGRSADEKSDWKAKAAAQGVMPMAAQFVTSEFESQLEAMDGEKDAEARALFLLRYRQPLMALREVEAVDGSPAKAQALFELHRLPEAGRAARTATDQHPSSPVAWLALARWELETGNYREAIDAAQKSIKLKKSPEAEELRKLAQLRLGK